MPQITKRIYPTGINTQIYVYAYGSGYYETVGQLFFDVGGIKNATSAALVFDVKSLYTNNQGGSAFIDIKSKAYAGILWKYSFGNFKVGSYTKDLVNCLDYINANNNISVDFVPTAIPDSGKGIQCEAYLSEKDANLSYIEYVTTEPSIDGFIVNGTSIDSAVTCTWTQEDVNTWIVQAILNGVVIASKSGTTETTCIFNAGELPYKGNYTFKLIATNGSSIELVKDVTLTRVEPAIISLEPDNVPQNINKQINVTWTAQNQQSYKLVLDGVTYSGTTAKAIVLPSNTLTSGTKTMTLTITYTSSWGDVRTATKIVTFVAFGNPPKPVIDGTTIYNTALPTFTWTSSEQVGYELKLRNSSNQDIIATGEVIGLSKQHTSSVALNNSSSYTLLLKIKNQYNLWSEWTSKVFTTSFIVPNTPSIDLVITNNASIIISFNIDYSSEFSKAEIWRKSNTTDWIRIAYNLDNTFSYEDKFVGNETYYYKVRAIGTSGGIAESETLSATLGELAPIKNFHLTNVEDFSETVELIGNPTARLNNNRKIVSTLFAGCKAPKIDKGETNYKSVNLSFSVKEDTYNKLIEIADSANVLLYRDGRGRKFYCQVNSYPTVNYDSGGYLSISFGIVEVAFVEGDFYSGSGNQPSLFFDGTWFFDGTVELDGEV